MDALGMIEVYGYLSAVEALDSALKSANVTFHSLTKVTGGLVTVMVVGDVGAIKAAMDAAASSAERVGNVISVHVIPRPAESVFNLTKSSSESVKENNVTENNVTGSNVTDNNITDNNVTGSNVEAVDEKIESQENNSITHKEIEAEEKTKIYGNMKKDELIKKTVEELRHIARALHMGTMTKNEIKFAKKKQLIDEICKFNERRDK